MLEYLKGTKKKKKIVNNNRVLLVLVIPLWHFVSTYTVEKKGFHEVF